MSYPPTANHCSEERELQPEAAHLFLGGAYAAEMWWLHWGHIQNGAVFIFSYRSISILLNDVLSKWDDNFYLWRFAPQLPKCQISKCLVQISLHWICFIVSGLQGLHRLRLTDAECKVNK